MILETIAIIKELAQSSCCCTTADHHCLGDISHLTEQALYPEIILVENDKMQRSTEYTKKLSLSLISLSMTTLLSWIQSLIPAIEFLMVCTMLNFSIVNPILFPHENIHQTGRITVYGRNNAIMTY
ncbi:MAG TPA: hypothetical protein VKA87_01660 [Nitrososphaeraceae archaeon]|nr:hypothetical protein [Nitrososphaeraceae archaeon]